MKDLVQLQFWILVLLFMLVGCLLIIRFIRARNKKENPVESIFRRYELNADADAFRRINDTSIPFEDRELIAKLFELKNKLNN